MNAVIVDDEILPASYLQELLGQYCIDVELAKVITDPIQAISYLNTHQVKLLFLDVEMPQMNGFELLRCLHKNHIPKVIFTSAHKHYAPEAFDISALHYLLKPVVPEKLIQAVNRALEDLNSNVDELKNVLDAAPVVQKKDLINLPDGQRYHLVAPEEIVRVEGKGSYSTFYLVDGRSILVSRRIRVYANQLSTELFVRPHQSHLVNKRMVAQFNKSDGGFLEMKDGSIIPVSTGLRKKVKEQFGL